METANWFVRVARGHYWFFKVGILVCGPLTPDELRRKAAAGEIRPNTPVRKGGDGGWVAAERVDGLFHTTDVSPPVLSLANIAQRRNHKQVTPASGSGAGPGRNDESTWQDLVVAARDSGQHAKAVELAEQAVREYPHSDWLWRELGSALTKLDRLDEAQEALDTAHSLNPDADQLWRYFAGLRRKQEDLEGEIESLKTLCTLGAATSHDLNQLGIAYHNYRDLANALKYYRLSAATEPDAVPWLNLALVYSNPDISQDADAADACRRALALQSDYERAKQLLETTKRKLAPLGREALAAAAGLVRPDEFFDDYINPFEMLQLEDAAVAEELEVKAIQQAMKRLEGVLRLDDGKVGWLDHYALDWSRAVRVVDELDNPAKRRYHVAVYRNKRLLDFLTRGDIRHFCYSDDYFPCDTEELLYCDSGFRAFLSKPFARQYNRVLTRAIEKRLLPLVEVLFDGRRWVEPQDDDLCFHGAYKRVDDLVDRMRSKAHDGDSRKVPLREIDAFLQEHSLPELLNLLPVHFASRQAGFVAEIRFLAMACWYQHDDPELSNDVLNLCKRFTYRNDRLADELEEMSKKLEEIVAKERERKRALAEQARAEQALAERKRAERARAETKRAERARAERARAERARAEQRALVERALAEQQRKRKCASRSDLRWLASLAILIIVGVGFLGAVSTFLSSAQTAPSGGRDAQSGAPVAPVYRAPLVSVTPASESKPAYHTPSEMRTEPDTATQPVDTAKTTADTASTPSSESTPLYRIPRGMKADLDKVGQAIGTERAAVLRMEKELESLGYEIELKRATLDRTSQSEVDEYNRKVDAYNSLLEHVRERTRRLNQLIDSYNEKLHG